MKKNKKSFTFKLFVSIVPFASLYSAHQKFGPQCIEIAWDLHDVAVQHDIPAMVTQSMPSWCALLQLAISSKKEDRALRQQLYRLKETHAPGQAYTDLLAQHDLHKLGAQFRNLARLQKPTQGIIHLMAQLNTMGYTQRPCSNIGSLFLGDLQKQLPDLFVNLDEGTVATYEPDGSSIIKPHQEFYEMHDKKFNPDGKKRFLLVDDKEANVLAAINAGWVGVHFTSMPKLYNDLQMLGIPVSEA